MTLPIRIPDLLPRIHELAPRTPGEQELWVLLPSFSLLRELSQTLLDEHSNFAGLRLMSADLAVTHILESRGQRAAETLDALAQADLLLQVLGELQEAAASETAASGSSRTERLPAGQARELDYLLRFPETRHGLLRTLTQLRSHVWPAGQALPFRSDRGRLLGRVLDRFEAKLESLGLMDRRALLNRALAAFETPCEQDPGHVLFFAPGPRLSGELEALFDAFPPHIPVELLTQAPEPPPGAAESSSLEVRAWDFGNPPLAIPKALPRNCFAMFTAQGELEELREALQRARALIVDGCPPHRIALVLADTQAYAHHLSRLSEEEGLPMEPGFGRPLAELPMAGLALRLIQLLAQDLPRKALLSCLSHPHFHRSEYKVLLRRENLAWLDRASREQACLGGRPGFMNALSRERESMRQRKSGKGDPARFDQVSAELDALLVEFESSARRLATAASHDEQILELQAFLTLHLAVQDDAETALRDKLLGALDALRWRDHMRLPVLNLTGLASHCTEILGEERARHPCYCPGGIRILSVDRFRGLQLDHVFLLGFNRGRFPRKASSDQWLDEADHQALRETFYASERTPPPGLFPAFEVGEEAREIQLEDLAVLIGGASKSFTLSWLRADAAGKQKSPAAWLRRFGRALAGSELHEELQERGWIQHLPWSPARRLAHRYDAMRPLSANESLCLAAFQGSDASLLETASLISDPRTEGLQRASTERQRLDSFAIGKDPEALSWDALQLGKPAMVDKSLSVTAFEKLGRCPLEFYLGRVLHARPLPEEPLVDGIRMLDLGSALHDALHKLFTSAQDKGLLEKDLEEAFEWMRGRITLEIDHQQKRLLSELTRDLPAAKDEYLQSWRKSLEELLQRDLAELLESGYRPHRFEEEIRAEIELGGGRVETRRVQLHGRMDRVDSHEDGRLRVLDYKSGGRYKPDDKEIKKEPFQGRYLQLPLYLLLLGELHAEGSGENPPEAELRGIAPDALAACKDELPRKHFSDEVIENDDVLRERLGILHELLMQGNFPFQKGQHCSYCDYRHGCPRHHRPSQERQDSCTTLDDYREMLVSKKIILLGERTAQEATQKPTRDET